MLSNNINGCYLSNDSSYIRFPYGEVNIIFHCMTLLIQVAYMFIQWFWYIRFPYGEVNIIFHCMRLLIQVISLYVYPMVLCLIITTAYFVVDLYVF